MTRVLRAHALFAAALGVLLVTSTWEGLFNALDLPRGEPELFAQVAGALFLAFGYLLWIAPRDVRLTHAVAAAAAFASGFGAIVVAAWLVAGDLPGVGDAGKAALAALAAVLAAFAVVEAMIASRNVAMLLPPD